MSKLQVHPILINWPTIPHHKYISLLYIPYLLKLHPFTHLTPLISQYTIHRFNATTTCRVYYRRRFIQGAPDHNIICLPYNLAKSNSINLHSFNLRTMCKSYPLPWIDDTTDTLTGSQSFSTLELKSG